MRNVDRDVLREAVEIAQIWDLFDSRERMAMQTFADLFEARMPEIDVMVDPFGAAKAFAETLPSPIDFVFLWTIRILELFFGERTEEATTTANLLAIKHAIVVNMAEVLAHIEWLAARFYTPHSKYARIAFLARNTAQQADLII